MQSFALQGVSRIATHLGLAPPIADALSLVASQSLSAFFDPALTLKTALTGIAPTVARQFALGGIELLGRSIGLDPRITALMGLPMAASIGGTVKGAINGSSIINSAKDALFSGQTLGGMVSIGASIGLDAIGAPSLVQGFLPGLLNQLTANLASGTGSKVFSGLVDNVAKFGKGVASVVGNVISFSAKVLEGAANLTKAGFAKAIEFFSGIFDRPTQESLFRAGGGSIENAIMNNTIILGETARVTFGGIDISWNKSTDTLTVINGSEERKFSNLRLSGPGDFFTGRLDYYNQLGDGSAVTQTFLNGQLWDIVYSDNHGLSLGVKPLDSYTPITFDNLGNLRNGQISYSQNEWLRFVDGAVVEAHFPANSYGMLKDPFQINTLPDNTVLLPGSGIMAGDLRGLDFSVTQDALGNVQFQLDTNGSDQDALDRLLDKLRNGAESFENGFERLKNRLLLLGSRTDEEIAVHKANEIQKVSTSPSNLYILSAETNALGSFVIRSGTLTVDDLATFENVNHTALAYQDRKTGQVYVLDIDVNGKQYMRATHPGWSSDLRRMTLEEWSQSYADFYAQELPVSALAMQKVQDIIKKQYFDSETNQLISNLQYDATSAILAAGLSLPIPSNSNSTYCSKLVYDILRDANIYIPGIDTDNPSPSLVWRAAKKWEITGDGI